MKDKAVTPLIVCKNEKQMNYWIMVQLPVNFIPPVMMLTTLCFSHIIHVMADIHFHTFKIHIA
jgi:hypothetical protein